MRIGGACDIWTTGRIETRLKGSPAGLDLMSSAADALSVSNGARVTLSFDQPPVAKDQNYWGFRWAGEHVDRLSELCASNAIVCVTDALPSKLAAQVGVWYEPRQSYTFIGLRAIPPGALVIVR